MLWSHFGGNRPVSLCGGVEKLKSVGQYALGLLLCIGTVVTMLVPNAEQFQNHELVRIIFWHLPCALTCTLFLCAAPYFAFKYLQTQKSTWDLRASAAMEMGLLTGLLTLATGIIFSDVQWGAPWNWDPRQTSFLLVMLILGAYFALRTGISDAEKRASHSAAYALASVLPVMFLIFVFPRILFSLHPATTLVSSNGMDPTYRSVFLSMFALVLICCIWIYKMRVRCGLLEEALENSNAKLDDRNGTAPTGVVRPVSIPTER
ncbi:MAG TPA: cytochrome c biogenesis protein CcsA [Fimbriimonadaceae bacterium]|nr:cytochrome c biogenesis protein CcsA [Fimbriimonadaceae bacterium]